MPRRWCQCSGCPACASPDRRPGNHNALYDADQTRALTCPGCFEQARKRRNSRPGRPSAAARGYDAAWRRISAQVTAGHTHCPECGQPFTSDNPATADHVIPKARGGTDDFSNLRCVCRACNSSRGGRTRKRSSQG